MTRALVVGAGIGGICAAAALRSMSDEVVLVERDVALDTGSARRGVPQANQLHNILTAAQVHIEAVLPGFLERLVAAGAVRGSVSTDTHVFELGLRMPERDLGLFLMCARRPVIEQVARDLAVEAGVEIRRGLTAVRLEVEGGTVVGVTVQDRDGGHSRLDADLVVDASGTGSEFSSSAGRAGPPIPVDTRRVAQWYTTAIYRRPERLRGSHRFLLVFPTVPRSRGGLASPVDDEHVFVSVSGRGDDTPPTDHASYLGYARTLEDPVIGDLIAACEPVADPTTFRKMHATWRHYELSDRPVVGLLPLGDAFASLNPLFGQGMSVAATQAAALGRLAAEAGLSTPDPDLPKLTQTYLDAAATAIREAWDLGNIVDPESGLPPSFDDPANVRAIAELLAEDADLHRTYVRVWHLLDPATILDSPDLARRIAERRRAIEARQPRKAD